MKYRNPAARLYHATRYSLSGLFCAFKQEQAFRYEAIVLVFILFVLSWLRPPFSVAVALAGAWLSVMVFELVNGAVERAFDLIEKEYNAQVKAGKDMLSASVFLMISFNVLLWAVFLFADFLF